MKKGIISLLFLVCSLLSFAQNEEIETELDLLRGPVSPAASLLGFSTTEIDRPTDLSSVTLSLQTATNSFSSIPLNYSLEIAPYFVLGTNTDFTTAGLKSQKFADVFKQSLLISVAITTPDQPDAEIKNTFLATGFKFSLLRGNYSTETQEKLEGIISLQKEMLHIINENVDSFLEENGERMSFLATRIHYFTNTLSTEELGSHYEFKNLLSERDSLQQALADLNDENKGELLAEKRAGIKTLASDFQLERIGWSLDLNGGLALEFRRQNFNNSRVHNVGAWLNGGYTTENGFLFLGLARFLHNPSTFLETDITPIELENYSSFDTGTRIIYAQPQSKFSIGAEAIYRSIMPNSQVDSSWKVVLNAEYALYKNQKLSLTIGKDFDGTLIKDGNLIAALTFIQGFGNKR